MRLLFHILKCEFILNCNIKEDYVVLHNCLIRDISGNSNYLMIQSSIKSDPGEEKSILDAINNVLCIIFQDFRGPQEHV